MNKMKLSSGGKIKKNNWAGFVLFAVFIVIQLAGLFVLGKIITKKVNSLIEQKHKLKAFEQKDTSLAKLQENFQLIKEDVEIIDRALPDKKEIVNFINQLEKEASASGILAKISFGAQSLKTESDGAKSISFSLNLKGTYFKTIEFIKRVEKMPQVVEIENIHIQSPDGIESQSNVVLTMKCYINPEF